MSISKGFVKALNAAAAAYLIGGVAYWAIGELFIRIVGKEMVFNPILSMLLVLPFWPVIIYADSKWVVLKPQDLPAFSAALISLYF
ncbi:MAG: hypothetical protein ACP5K1_04895 [Candidatus Bathyarchaeia archaeon]